MPCRSKLQANLQRTETEVSQNSITEAFSSTLTNTFRTKMTWCYVVKLFTEDRPNVDCSFHLIPSQYPDL